MKWGIVGCGQIAQRNVVPALAAARDAQLISVMSRNLEGARAFAQRNGVPQAFDSLDAMLHDPALDAVYIATPNSLHAGQAIAAARAGKHVLCDKPMALTVADAQRMIAAAGSSGTTLGVVFQNRYHPAHREARRRVEAGFAGEMQTASATLCVGQGRGFWQGWRRDAAVTGSGAIAGQALHPIDILRYLLDSEVVEVCAMTDEHPPARPVDEMVHALLRFANGAHATIVAGTVAPRLHNDVTLCGSNGKIACHRTLGTPPPDAKQELVLTSAAPEVRVDYSHSTSPARFAEMINDFSDCIARGVEPPISGRNGLQMVRIADAVQESSRTRRAVQLA
jgi:1,5-anhydro-D-fructose reductase (1,5-anhydro-D-mannitol-forming)